jgi:tol-pal system protein YbgF
MTPARLLPALLLGLGLWSAAPAAHALFSDDEARKAILELRQRIAAQEESQRSRTAELAAALAARQEAQQALQAQQVQHAEQLAALRRSLLELNTQIESLRTELARLRGADEQLTRDVTELQRRQRDIAQGIDDRLRRLEPQKVSFDGREFMAEPEEKRVFDEALGFMRTGEFEKAIAGFQLLQRRWPGSGYLPAAQFWAGNAHYGRKDYKEAVAAFRAFVNAAPKHPRAPEALLALANSQAEMKDRPGARKTLDELIKTYPQSEAAQAGKERLATLK